MGAAADDSTAFGARGRLHGTAAFADGVDVAIWTSEPMASIGGSVVAADFSGHGLEDRPESLDAVFLLEADEPAPRLLQDGGRGPELRSGEMFRKRRGQGALVEASG